MDDVPRALIANADLGGDSIHRGSLLGAILGAARTADALPEVLLFFIFIILFFFAVYIVAPPGLTRSLN